MIKRLSIEKLKIENLLKILTYSIAFIAFLSVFVHIGIIYKGIALILAIFSLYVDFKSGTYLKRGLLNLLSILIIVTSFYRLNLDDLATPIIEGLTLLLFIKFLEKKGFRDYMQIFAISLFLLTGSALFNIDISFLLYFAALLFLIAINIVVLTFYVEDNNLQLPPKATIKTLFTALLIPLVSLPMMALLFIILPRTNFPLFTFLNRAEKGLTGFTDNIRLGDVSDIQADNSIIFRASIPKIDENLLYWRGVVLDYFDSIAWSKSSGAISDKVEMAGLKGEIITQNIFLEAYDYHYLFALDRPFSINMKEARLLANLTISLNSPINRRIRYEVNSSAAIYYEVISIDKEKYLQLPDNISPKVKELALQITKDAENDLEKVTKIVKYLNSGEYKYSLQNLPITANPLDDFLFKYRYGNCEYYASASATMLRIVGLPSRLVVGYRGGHYNPLGGYYAVTQQSAHVWVEVFVDKKWIRIDPTPGSVILGQGQRPLWLTIRLYSDTINYYWNRMVIGYDFERQFKGVMVIQNQMKSLKKANFENLKTLLGKVIVILIIITSIITIVYFIRQRKPLEQRLVNNFEKRLRKKGYKRQSNQGLREFVNQITDIDLRQRALLFVEHIEGLFYRDKNLTRDDERRLKDILKGL
ncbi:MAG TPA: DUF3488 domain-containing transglutaminase family protein [Nitrospirae bacterium]|nr:DUF3488 domain-containing transglutaminase family protein [Nitrospirota bacterium]